MLANKVRNFGKTLGWCFIAVAQKYSSVSLALNISLKTKFGQFYLPAEDGATFYARGQE